MNNLQKFNKSFYKIVKFDNEIYRPLLNYVF